MTYKILLPVSIVLFLALGFLTWRIQASSSDAIRTVAEREMAALAGQYGNAVKSFFERPMNEAQALADSISSVLAAGGVLPRETAVNMLEGLQKSHSTFFASGTAWEPGAFDGQDAAFDGKPGMGEKGRFIPYLAKGAPIEPLADLETSGFYTEPKQRNRSTFSDPYHYQVGNTDVIMTTASAVVQKDGRFAGIVLIDLQLTTVDEFVSGIKVYDSGWGAVLTQGGYIVTHRDPAMEEKNIFNTSMALDKDGLKKAMAAGEPFVETHGGDFYYYYPITFAGTGQSWYFAVSAPLDEVLADVARIRTLTIGISAGSMLLITLLIFIIVRRMVKPIGYLAGRAQIIAGGDLKIEIDDRTFGGEIKELSSSLKEMIASLLENISKAEAMSEDARLQTEKATKAMREAEEARLRAESAKKEGMLDAATRLEGMVSVVSSASMSLSSLIQQSEHGSSEQAARVGETATAMEEMNVAVLEVSKSAGTASECSNQTRQNAQDGFSIVQNAVNGIQDVHTVSLSLKDAMNNLSEQAGAVSHIMNVISEIADQTNLLALNAAIEAARAGEAGRGFAVVADEVRKLAEKTMQATGDVGSSVKNIQDSVTSSINQVEKAVSLIEVATENSNKSGEALNAIVGMAEETADQVRAIATASEEQSATSEEINRSVSEINAIAAQTSESMQEAARAVEELAEQANNLSALIEEMKNQ